MRCAEGDGGNSGRGGEGRKERMTGREAGSTGAKVNASEDAGTDRLMQGEIPLNVGGHREDKMIRRMPQLQLHL